MTERESMGSALRPAGDGRGAALVIALLLMGVLLLLGTSLLSISSTEIQIASNERDTIQAFYVAEAGLQAALNEVKRNAAASAGYYDDPNTLGVASARFGRGEYVYALARLGGDPSNPILSITSTGSVGNVRRVVRARTEPAYGSRYRSAVHAREEIDVRGEVETDSYDSGIPPGAASCSPGCPNRQGTIRTDATSRRAMGLEGRVVIGGDALVGPGGNPATAMSVGEGVTITGERGVEDRVLPMPPAVPPSALPLRGELKLEGRATDAVSASAEIGGHGIALGGDATLTLGSPGVTTIIVVASMRIEGNAQLVVQGRVSLYVTDRVDLRGNAGVHPGGIPANLEVQFSDTGEDFRMDGNARFFGAVYGRNAAITLRGNAVVFGSLVGEQINLLDSARVHYDEALGRRRDFVSGYKIAAWQEVLPR